MTSRGSVVMLNHLPKERFIVASRIHSSHIIYREDSPELGTFCIHLNSDNCYTVERSIYSVNDIARHLKISVSDVVGMTREFGVFKKHEHLMKTVQSKARRNRHRQTRDRYTRA